MSDITYKPGRKPHPKETRRIFKNIDREGYDPSIKCFIKDGGYKTLKKVLKMEPADVINEVKKSGLRGRGGAGFPTGVKWTFIPKGNTKPVYLVCNCDESEPGTFKDRFIVHQDPHQLLEGMIIACYAVQAHYAVIYMREEFPEAARIMNNAIKEAEAKGFLGTDIQKSGFDLKIVLHRGAGAYICGEETGLINSIEGVRPYPRIKPPFFPAAIGLYGCPTIVNNVESLCQVRQVMLMGGEAYAAEGAQRSVSQTVFPGDMLNMQVAGQVQLHAVPGGKGSHLPAAEHQEVIPGEFRMRQQAVVGSSDHLRARLRGG